jgi:hypothetical protein
VGRQRGPAALFVQTALLAQEAATPGVQTREQTPPGNTSEISHTSPEEQSLRAVQAAPMVGLGAPLITGQRPAGTQPPPTDAQQPYPGRQSASLAQEERQACACAAVPVRSPQVVPAGQPTLAQEREQYPSGKAFAAPRQERPPGAVQSLRTPHAAPMAPAAACAPPSALAGAAQVPA